MDLRLKSTTLSRFSIAFETAGVRVATPQFHCKRCKLLWPIVKNLPTRSNLDVQNQRFVVGSAAFTFFDAEAFDLG